MSETKKVGVSDIVALIRYHRMLLMKLRENNAISEDDQIWLRELLLAIEERSET